MMAENSNAPFERQIELERQFTDQCKGELMTRSAVTEAELGTIGVEGAMKHWPPLPVPRVSIGPLIDAALKLCEASR